MARPLRLEFAVALYHMTARGDRREPIYEDDNDRTAFLGLLGRIKGTNKGDRAILLPQSRCRAAGQEKNGIRSCFLP